MEKVPMPGIRETKPGGEEGRCAKHQDDGRQPSAIDVDNRTAVWTLEHPSRSTGILGSACPFHRIFWSAARLPHRVRYRRPCSWPCGSNDDHTVPLSFKSPWNGALRNRICCVNLSLSEYTCASRPSCHIVLLGPFALLAPVFTPQLPQN